VVFDNGNCYRIFLANGRSVIVWGKNKPKAIEWFLNNTDKYTNKDILKVQREWIPPLCGTKWLRENKNKHADFVPEIDITIDGKTKLHIRGNIKKGSLKKVLK
jgi:hypothetical protein